MINPKKLSSKKSFFFFTLFIWLAAAPLLATPSIIAHRGGGARYPENTLLSFTQAIQSGADALELDVQVTADGVVAVYHPSDLSVWTDGRGKIADHLWSQLRDLDAAYHYQPQKGYPFRGKGIQIPSLQQVLDHFPKTLCIIDLKSLPAEPLVDALIATISDEESGRLLFYSTESAHLELIERHKPHWQTFEKRALTRQKLLELNQSGQTSIPYSPRWSGFELKRHMNVSETFALGSSSSTVEFQLWNREVIAKLRQNKQGPLVLFGINNKLDWQRAVQLQVDAVYSDDPQLLLQIKREKALSLGLQFGG